MHAAKRRDPPRRPEDGALRGKGLRRTVHSPAGKRTSTEEPDRRPAHTPQVRRERCRLPERPAWRDRRARSRTRRSVARWPAARRAPTARDGASHLALADCGDGAFAVAERIRRRRERAHDGLTSVPYRRAAMAVTDRA